MKNNKIRQILYCLAFAVFVAEYIFWSFQEYFLIPSIVATIMILAVFVLGISLYSKKELLLSCLIVIGSFVVFLTSKDASLIKLALFIVSGRGIDFRKVVKCDFWMKIVCMATTFILFFLNVVPDVQLWVNSTLKHSLGFSHPNTLGALLFFVVADYYYAYGRKVTIVNSVGVGAICAFLLAVPHSRTSVFAILLLYLFLLIKERKFFKKFANNKILRVVVRNSFAIIALLVLGSMFLFSSGSEVGNRINIALSNRLQYISRYYDEYGITLLGNDFTGFWSRLNTLDNAFAYIIFRYGALFFLVAALAFRKLMDVFYIKKNYTLLFTFLVLFIYGFSENGWIRVSNNVFLVSLSVLLFPNFLEEKDRNESQIK